MNKQINIIKFLNVIKSLFLHMYACVACALMCVDVCIGDLWYGY